MCAPAVRPTLGCHLADDDVLHGLIQLAVMSNMSLTVRGNVVLAETAAAANQTRDVRPHGVALLKSGTALAHDECCKEFSRVPAALS